MNKLLTSLFTALPGARMANTIVVRAVASINYIVMSYDEQDIRETKTSTKDTNPGYPRGHLRQRQSQRGRRGKTL